MSETNQPQQPPATALRVTSLTQACGACPAQWEGRTEDGRWIYVRYRWGALQIGVGDTIEQAIDRDDDASYYRELGDGFDGFLTLAELREATNGVFEWPASAEFGSSSARY